MEARETEKFVVVRFTDYRREKNGSMQHGPADVFFSKERFANVAKSYGCYGWDGKGPMDLVNHMGDEVRLIEVLAHTMRPTRVVYF